VLNQGQGLCLGFARMPKRKQIANEKGGGGTVIKNQVNLAVFSPEFRNKNLQNNDTTILTKRNTPDTSYLSL
jgi:hypothetical protein